MNEDCLARWHVRIARAAALLGRRLDDPPSLAELAEAAAVSPFHFHRIWRALTGETVNGSVTRLRIEKSKAMLRDAGATVTGTAMATGFGTPQSFARAFVRQTGSTPSRYVKAPHDDTRRPPPGPVEIVLHDAVTVVALRREGGAYVALNATFQRVWDWAETHARLAGFDGFYGIPLDDPESVPQEALRYDACIVLDPVAVSPPPPLPLRSMVLPAGPHARLRIHGPYDGLQDATQWLVGVWLPRSGHEPADAPVLHRFHNDPEQVSAAELVTDILLPLAAEPR